MMNEDPLARALRAMHEEDLANTPTSHSQRTEDCPPLSRFARARDAGWSDGEKAHVDTCPYCQKAMGMQLMAVCPSPLELIRCAVESAPYQRAIKRHLEVEDCRRCNELLQSAWMKSLVSLIRGGKRQLKELGDWLDRSAVGFAPVPVAARSGTEAPAEVFRMEATSGDECLSGWLERDDDGQLAFVVELNDPEPAETRVSVMLLSGDLSIQNEIELTPSGEHRWAGQGTLGDFREIIPKAGPECLFLISPVRDE